MIEIQDYIFICNAVDNMPERPRDDYNPINKDTGN
jgi:hypothetical protein